MMSDDVQVSGRDAFLSYASRDAELAAHLCGLLERSAITVWMAPRDVPAGANYADAIVRAINACRTLLVILSAHSVGSAHVGKEIERASSKGRPIVAVRLDDIALTPALEYFLSESQWIDARLGLEAALPKLIDGIRRLSSAGGAAAGATVAERPAGIAVSVAPPVSPVRRYTLPAAIAVAVVFAGVLLAERAGWLQRAPPPSAALPAAAPPLPEARPAAQKSIAVLPFEDLSEKKDQGYFSDGLSEELIDLLSKVQGLRVPARTSSFYFRGRQATLAEIGKALNVSHVLEGSVRKSGKALRISTELVSVSDDSRVWSETYDRQLDDVFKVQDDIAGSVVAALKVSMLGESQRAAPTANSDAYLHFLRARELSTRGEPAFEPARDELLKAVQLDPAFAQAWLELGSLYMDGFVGGSHGPYELARRQAVDALQRALTLDPGLVEAHVEVARLYYMLDWDIPAAQAELKHAAELAPGDRQPNLLWLTGYIANSEGRFDQAIASQLKARDLDPLDIDNYRQLGNAYYRAGRLDEAAAAFNDALQRNPSAYTVRYRLGLVRLAQHRPEEALIEFNLERNVEFSLIGPPLALDALGRRSESDKILGQALASKTIPFSAAYQLALIYAARGQTDAAFQWLQRAFQQRDAGMHWMKFDPILKGLNSDPRFKALLAQMHQA
jgi:TolB-like protein/Flp pilus assembly protein TadD